MLRELELKGKYERFGWPAQPRPDVKPPEGWSLPLITLLMHFGGLGDRTVVISAGTYASLSAFVQEVSTSIEGVAGDEFDDPLGNLALVEDVPGRLDARQLFARPHHEGVFVFLRRRHLPQSRGDELLRRDGQGGVS